MPIEGVDGRGYQEGEEEGRVREEDEVVDGESEDVFRRYKCLMEEISWDEEEGGCLGDPWIGEERRRVPAAKVEEERRVKGRKLMEELARMSNDGKVRS